MVAQGVMTSTAGKFIDVKYYNIGCLVGVLVVFNSHMA